MSFPSYLGSLLEMNVVNRSKSGENCFAIFEKILQDIKNFKKDDIILIQWPFSNRIKNLKTKSPIFVNSKDVESRIYYKNFYLPEKEVINIIGYNSLLKELLKDRTWFYNFADGQDFIEKKCQGLQYAQDNYLPINKSLFTQFLDKELYLKDYHPNIEGNKRIAQLYYEKISKKFNFDSKST